MFRLFLAVVLVVPVVSNAPVGAKEVPMSSSGMRKFKVTLQLEGKRWTEEMEAADTTTVRSVMKSKYPKASIQDITEKK